MLSVVLAFAAGFITFVSPCFLPIVPVFIGQLMGERTQQLSRKGACLNAVCFMLGFSIVFIAIWISIGLIGLVAGRYVEIFRIIGGVVLVLIGLHVARLIRIPLLDKYYRGDLKTPAAIRNGVLRSGLMGVVFGAGWTPCIGPILGGILAFASQSETAFAGAFLMLAYCIGLGVPIVLVAIGAVDVRARFGFFKKYHALIEVITGILIVVIGILMITNLFARIAFFPGADLTMLGYGFGESGFISAGWFREME